MHDIKYPIDDLILLYSHSIIYLSIKLLFFI